MKNKAIEIRDKMFKSEPNYTPLEAIQEDIIQVMLEFGHYVAEEQKKQCIKEAKIECYCDSNESCVGKIDINSILNSKNVCNEQ